MTTPFCKLLDVDQYEPCRWDFATDREACEYFVLFFREQYDRTLALAVALESADYALQRADACRREFNAFLDDLLASPEKYPSPCILTVDYVRDGILRKAGFHDPYLAVKQRDNAQAIKLLAEICRELDNLAESDRLHAVIAGALAGNIFDMGVAATAQRMLQASLCFVHTRDSLPARPWLVDDFDALRRRFSTGRPHRKAVVFVDNAGSDFVLGMLPLARYLAQRGTEVLLVGNELPSLNDMTVHDIRTLWDQVVAIEPSFGTLPIRPISSGTGEPLIDLRRTSTQLNLAAADADLVILEGMGRAIESNYLARFNCDVLKIAMIKDQLVADRFGGKLYDVVCRFEPA